MANKLSVLPHLSDAEAKLLRDYLSVRLGIPALQWSSLGSADKYVSATSDIYTNEGIGIFRFIIKDFYVYINLWQQKDDPNVYVGRVEFRYSHVAEGCNGSSTLITLRLRRQYEKDGELHETVLEEI